MENVHYTSPPIETSWKKQYAPMYFEDARPTVTAQNHAWKIASIFQDKAVFNRYRAQRFACLKWV